MYWLTTEGVCVENIYPYRAVNQDPVLLTDGTQTFRISGFDSSTNTTQMKRWLVEEGPLVADFSVYHDFWAFWGGGMWLTSNRQKKPAENI